MTKRSLRSLHGGFVREAERARTAFSAASTLAACFDPHRNNREWCALYLHDAWARFCRSLVLESAFASPTTLSGRLVPPVVSSEQLALSAVRKAFKHGGPAWEPQWASPADAVRAAVALSVSNRGQVSAGLGASPNPADDLRLVRNFIAHRNRRTAFELHSLGLRLRAPVGDAVNSLLGMPSPPYSSLFEQWSYELTTIGAVAAS